MTLGKQLLHFIISFIICNHLSPTSSSSNLSPSVLKGGLVYSEESSLGPVYLNRDYVSFVRTIDTFALEQSAQATRDFTTLYHTLCHTITQHLTPFDHYHSQMANQNEEQDEIIFSPVKYFIREGRQVCKNMGARLPELRTENSTNRFRFAAIQKKITKFSAGIHFDQATKKYRYDSDSTPANYNEGGSPFKKLQYGGFYTGKTFEGEWEWDSYLVAQGPNWFVLYNHPAWDMKIRLADQNDHEHKDFIMCIKPLEQSFEKETKENNLFLQLADHACKRDKGALIAATQYILTEIEMITNLNITIKSYEPKMEDFFPTIMTEESDRAKRSTDNVTNNNNNINSNSTSKSPEQKQKKAKKLARKRYEKS